MNGKEKQIDQSQFVYILNTKLNIKKALKEQVEINPENYFSY